MFLTHPSPLHIVILKVDSSYSYSDLKTALTTLTNLRDSQRNELCALKVHKQGLIDQIVEAQDYNQDPKATAPAGTSGNLLVLQSMEQIKEYQNSMKKKKRASGGMGVTNVRKKSKTSGTSKIIDLTDNPTHIAGLEIMELPDHLLTSHQRRSEKKTLKSPNRRPL